MFSQSDSRASRKHLLRASSAALALAFWVVTSHGLSAQTKVRTNPTTWTVTVTGNSDNPQYSYKKEGGNCPYNPPATRLQVCAGDTILWNFDGKVANPYFSMSFTVHRESHLKAPFQGKTKWTAHGDQNNMARGTVASDPELTPYNYAVAVFDPQNNEILWDDPQIIIGKPTNPDLEALIDDQEEVAKSESRIINELTQHIKPKTSEINQTKVDASKFSTDLEKYLKKHPKK